VHRILALGEARGYEPGTSQARYLFAVLAWCFEPIENGVDAVQRAREGLIAGGDLANAGYTYHQTMYYLMDCAFIAGHLGGRAGGGADLRAAYRQRADGAAAWQLLVAGWCAARRNLRRSRCGGAYRPVRRQPAGASPRASQPGYRRRHLRRSGVPTRAIAEAIGRAFDLPVASVAADDVLNHFGWIGKFFAMDLSATSTVTRELLGWTPTGPTLVEDLDAGAYSAR
jgi:hypothetical protein